MRNYPLINFWLLATILAFAITCTGSVLWVFVTRINASMALLTQRLDLILSQGQRLQCRLDHLERAVCQLRGEGER